MAADRQSEYSHNRPQDLVESERADFANGIFAHKLTDDSYPGRDGTAGNSFAAIEMTPTDYLQNAISNLNPAPVKENSNEPFSYSTQNYESVANQDVYSRSSASSPNAQSAERTSAQWALLSDPAAMRSLLPELLVQGDSNLDEQLDPGEIYRALEKKDLPVQDRDALTILQNNFAAFKPDVDDNKRPKGGISDFDLAVLDKSVNRQNDGDPLFGYQAKNAIGTGLAKGAALGLYWTKGQPAKQRLMETALYAVSGLLADEAVAATEHYVFENSGSYDRLQKEYEKAIAPYSPDAASPSSPG